MDATRRRRTARAAATGHRRGAERGASEPAPLTRHSHTTRYLPATGTGTDGGRWVTVTQRSPRLHPIAIRMHIPLRAPQRKIKIEDTTLDCSSIEDSAVLAYRI